MSVPRASKKQVSTVMRDLARRRWAGQTGDQRAEHARQMSAKRWEGKRKTDPAATGTCAIEPGRE